MFTIINQSLKNIVQHVKHEKMRKNHYIEFGYGRINMALKMIMDRIFNLWLNLFMMLFDTWGTQTNFCQYQSQNNGDKAKDIIKLPTEHVNNMSHNLFHTT